MKKLSSIIFIAIVAFSFYSCKKKVEGCMDPLSLNYNPDATEDNHDCDYSTVDFYASGDSINGKKVLEIVIHLGSSNEYLGNITTFNQPTPNDCSSAGTVIYKIKSGESHTWHAQYNLSEDDIALKQGSFSPSRAETCITIDLLP